MSTAISNPQNRIADYCNKIAGANPSEALQIALAEAERAKAVAEQAQAEYRAMAEVEFDAKGRIVKANLAGLYRLAQAYSGSQIVPEQYRAKPSDCFIACQMAFRLGVDPLAYMQASYIVHGKPGIEAKLAVAMLNTSGHIRGRVRFRDERDSKGVMIASTAVAVDAETGEEVTCRITDEMVKAEGWLTKSGSKWKTVPELMFHYRSATWLIRQYYPEVLMGMQTREELDDAAETAPPARNLAELTARIEGPQNGNSQHAEPDDVVTADGEVIDAGERPQTQTSHASQSTTALLEEAAAAFAVCELVTEVEKCEREFCEKAPNPEDAEAVRALGEQHRERVRQRGERSNKK